MKWRRRQYLIDHRFQWRFVRYIIIPMVLGVIMVSLADYYFIWGYFTRPSLTRYEGLGHIALEIAGYVLFYELCLVIPILVIIGVIFSHRVSGPLFNIARNLKAIGEGDLSRRITLRDKDELKNLEAALNEMVDNLSNKFGEVKKGVALLEERLSALEKEMGKESPDLPTVREEMKLLTYSLDMVKDRLAKFKR